jgi:hypothetical protein
MPSSLLFSATQGKSNKSKLEGGRRVDDI